MLSPKGTGAIIGGPAPDGTAVGGNARGAGSLDWQVSRGLATQVASGATAVAVGLNNTASAVCSISVGYNNNAINGNSVAFGVLNTSSGASTTAIGIGNTAGLGNVAVAVGYQNTASGAGGIAVGYSNNSSGGAAIILGSSSIASAVNSMTLGRECISSRYGQSSFASGNFSAAGDCQRVNFLLRKTITNSAAATELALDGATSYLTIPSGRSMAFVAHVYGIKSDGSAWAYFIRKGVIKNVGGTTSMPAGVTPVCPDENLSVCGLTIDRNDTGDYLSIMVTNPTGAEIWRWVAHVEGVEAVYGI